MYYYRLFNPIVLVRKLSPKGILSNVSLESKDYTCIQLACNLASTYILNLTIYQLCSMQIILAHNSLPKHSCYAFPSLFFLNDMNVLSSYFSYSHHAHSSRLYFSNSYCPLLVAISNGTYFHSSILLIFTVLYK